MAELLRIAVLDDDEAELARIRSILERFGETGAECFTDPGELLRAAQGKPPFDLAFLDVYLPGGTGIEAAEGLEKVSPETDIAFITSSRDHAVDAFRLRALHYLVKPVTDKDVEETLRRREAMRNVRRASLLLTVNRETCRVYLDQIVSVASSHHMVEIRQTDGRCIRVWQTFSELEGLLGKNFLPINRGLIVNMNEVVQMGPDFCSMSDGSCLPVRQRDHTAIQKQYSEFLMDELHVMAAKRGDGK